MLGVPTFNERITREALLNAASHRSYRQSSSIFVRQYRDRLVIDSPGGLPSGITTENILEKQSPRNHLIANIFALCGLVERAGQGMNLIYELCIKEAKSLPDFKGTDPYFVSVTLNGIITDEKLLLIFKKIDSAVLEAFTTEDYLVINSLYHTQKFSPHLRSHVKKLVELGVAEHIGRGKYMLAKHLCEAVGNERTHSPAAQMSREEAKSLILNCIEQSGKSGTPPRAIQQILTSKSRRQIQLLLSELQENGYIYAEGQTTAVRWFLTSKRS